MNNLAPLKKATLPPPPVLRQIMGPGFILLGLGLGSGELILWPYLVSNFGLGIIWGAVLGITFQFFMNMEIERYALINGESIFVGFARKLRLLPAWFILSTLLPWMWPGIIGASAVLLGSLLGITNIKLLSILMLIGVGLILTLGPVLYKTQETIQKTLILIAVPFLFVLALYLGKNSDWTALASGIVGIGDGFWFLPVGIPLASFLAALAFSGAGGNLNLAQSFYVKEKGYGMGKFSGRITSLLTGKKEDVLLEGTTFTPEGQNLSHFKRWWKLVNIEHAAVFWFAGTLTILLLAFLAFITLSGRADTSSVAFVIQEAHTIGASTIPILGSFFLLVAGLMLFSTQLGVFDVTSRILTENVCLLSPKRFPTHRIPKIFYAFLWLQIAIGVIIFMLDVAQPLTLIMIGAVLNAFAMFVHIGLTLWLNMTSLEKPLRPSWVRITAMATAFLFFGGFSLFTLINSVR
ncbi:MAG: Nramp family divalent metal transporter [bacterium]|nr:Nramp family divalent metal transporter [bacterium]